jgi:hypothetical protein
MVVFPTAANRIAKEGAMAIMERHVQFKIKSEKTYWEWEKSWEGVESRLGGFPPKRHYSLIAGSENQGTMVWEREWESMAVMDAAYTKMN